MSVLFHSKLFVTATAANGDDWDLTVTFSGGGDPYSWSVNDIEVGQYIPLIASTPANHINMFKIKSITDLGASSHITVEYADTGTAPTALPATQTTLVTSAFANGMLCPPYYNVSSLEAMISCVNIYNAENQVPVEIASVENLTSTIREVFKAGILRQ